MTYVTPQNGSINFFLCVDPSVTQKAAADSNFLRQPLSVTVSAMRQIQNPIDIPQHPAPDFCAEEQVDHQSDLTAIAVAVGNLVNEVDEDGVRRLDGKTFKTIVKVHPETVGFHVHFQGTNRSHPFGVARTESSCQTFPRGHTSRNQKDPPVNTVLMTLSMSDGPPTIHATSAAKTEKDAELEAKLTGWELVPCPEPERGWFDSCAVM